MENTRLSNYLEENIELDNRAIIDRIKKAYGYNTSTDTGFELDFKLPSKKISGWLQRKSIPFNFILLASIETNTSLDFLVFGKENSAVQNTSKVEKLKNANALFVGGSVLNSTINQNINNELLERINKIEFELLQMRGSLIADRS